ncbi:bifunctional folylpolyglutamate synthase/dihydrofolate synthase [Kordiimonas sediminis]|uniref:Dihydrofolate synthase/folylpolyglutamate synthase n=1 Tax=Kordiimonas sediminis TaxID=1735581 RepID=A0A919E5R5_9PROT|nr:folylpolyglutamate synthase/dihydrofolate synthase family protein [Kordiimonas sediminis]GHF16719.1 bifunctional folylpolyglutamate synthase/dihydrofolate synthase [Kordiimonas sediminis]
MDTSASDAILARLLALHPKKIDLSLDRLIGLLKKLGDPHLSLPPVIHIAGTNGKGSTVATLRAFAEAAGHRVHVYSSPHLVRFAERIRLAGTLIGEDDLATLLEEVEQANGDDPITFFEVTTAAAFLAFSRVPADLCILEVGLGGRLDATNVIPNPVAVGITPVSFDHEQFLGDKLEGIAWEKAGIIKPNCTAVIGPQLGAAEQSIRSKILEMGATGYFYKRDWSVQVNSNGTGFTYEDGDGSLNLPMPKLRGIHQVNNAGLAIKLARAQKAITIPDAAIKAGLGWVRWPARLQCLNDSNLRATLPEGAELWLDGGHNPAAAGILRSFLQSVDPLSHSSILIVGMLDTKDYGGYLKPLAPLLDKVIAVPIPGEDNAADPAKLAAAATDAGVSGIVARDVESALSLAVSSAKDGRPPFVLIGGSLYLAGQVLRTAEIFPT